MPALFPADSNKKLPSLPHDTPHKHPTNSTSKHQHPQALTPTSVVAKVTHSTLLNKWIWHTIKQQQDATSPNTACVP